VEKGRIVRRLPARNCWVLGGSAWIEEREIGERWLKTETKKDDPGPALRNAVESDRQGTVRDYGTSLWFEFGSCEPGVARIVEGPAHDPPTRGSRLPWLPALHRGCFGIENS
jgi:hypothetical protein